MAFVTLDPEERQALGEALLSAFSSRGALEQVSFYYLGKNLAEITEGGNLANTVMVLIQWADTNEQTSSLITGARKINTGNSKLREFEEAYKTRRSKSALGTAAVSQALPKEIREQLRDALGQVPQSGSFEGRSAYLIGLPWAQSLNRAPTNTFLDLDLIIDQLDSLGQMDSGAWPLLILIDNAVSPVKGTTLGKTLLKLRDTLAQAYKEAGNAGQ